MTTIRSGLRAGHYGLFALAASTLIGCSGGGGPATDVAEVLPAPGPAPAPAPGTYSVGGTATGLVGSIKLRINSSEEETVASATVPTGRFSFDTSLPPGTAYSVAIAALPNKQNCQLTNAAGTVTTANVVSVGVTCATRGWTAGQQVDGDDEPVATFDAGMDREGRVVAILVKGNRTTAKLYAVRGSPGAAGTAAQWSAPVRIDSDQVPYYDPSGFKSNNMTIAVAPNGNAHAVWGGLAPCGAQSYAQSNFPCAYIHSSVYSAASDTWSPPVRIADTPYVALGNNSLSYKPIPLINNRGDVAVQFRWYNQILPVDTGFSNQRGALAWRAFDATTFQVRAFTDILYPQPYAAVLDNLGGIAIAAQRAQAASSNDDIVYYAGTAAAGFSATQGAVLDTFGNGATLRSVVVGPTNDVLLTWDQNDGTGLKIFGASAASATAAWSVPVPIATRTAEGVGLVDDAGNALLYASCTGYVRPKATGIWASKAPAIPSGCGFSEANAVWTGDGSFLTYGSVGQWNTYYQPNNAMARESSAALASTDYLLGFAKGWGSASKLMYTKKADGNFVGAVLIRHEYDTLPTASATAGDGRSGVDNLWGFYLK